MSQDEVLRDAACIVISKAKDQSFRDAANLLAEAGLFGLCAQEADGGMALALSPATQILNAAGEQQLNFPLAEQVLLAKYVSGSSFAAALTSGHKIGTVAWQGDISSGCAGHAAHAKNCDWLLVRESSSEGTGAALIDMAGQQMHVDATLDPEQPQYWIDIKSPTILWRINPEQYAALLHEAHVLSAAFAHGAAEHAMNATVAHLSTRVQFGGPLTSKQALRHSLSRMKLLQEVSGAAIARVLANNEYGEQRAAAASLVGSLRNAAFVIEKAIHLHGGMGFTWATPLHYGLRNVRKLEAAFSAGTLSQDLGRRFIERS
jgi:alkylation response protein AidB-like acyl-CoA dehydrogenase